jgi:hypothetical protein
MANPKAPRWQQIYAIPGMLIFGTATVVTQKFLFEQTGEGRYGLVHEFRKPWFQTDTMFLGMTLSLLAYVILGKKDRAEVNGEQVIEEKKANWKLYFSAALPALCDLSATSLMNVQLLYINASVWQMLRGSMVIFSSIFCAFILKRPHYPYMWWAILCVVCALTVVGFAAVMSTGAGKEGVSTERTILAIFLTIVAQLIQATQLVIEDFLLHDLDTHPLQLVGLKGFWGFVLCTSLAFPVIQNVSGQEGNGVHEDLFDTFTMLKNTPLILAFIVLYVFFILCYNIGGMLVTNVFSAVYRTILEGLRTLCIWAVQLILFYSLKGNKSVGEEWNRWSFMQLAGFALLFTGSLMYNKIVRLPCFQYPDDVAIDPKMSQPLLSGTNAGDAKL